MALLFGIGAVVLLLVAIWRSGSATAEGGGEGSSKLTIDSEGITLQAPSFHERLLWSEIRRVRIMTTGGGPWSEDLFYVIDRGGPNFVVPHWMAEERGVLPALEKNLGNLDERVVRKAMGSTSNQFFTIWQASGASTEDASEK